GGASAAQPRGARAATADGRLRRTLIGWLLATACIAAVAGSASTVTTAEAASDEQTAAEQVHAAYVVNFIRYTEWPDDGSTAPYVIGVIGSVETVLALRQVAARAGPIRDRPLEIRLLGATRAPPGSASA